MTAATWSPGYEQPDGAPTATSPERLRQLELEGSGVVRLDTIEATPPEPLLVGRLAPGAHSILFGDGDVGKGTLACRWILDAVEDGYTVLVVDYESHRDEWTLRLDGLGGRDGRAGVYHVSPVAQRWRGPLWEHLEDIRQAVEVTGADIIVIDSIAVACQGHDPKDDTTAAAYCAAVNGLGVTTLSIAHVTKAGASRWPYGSVFWHNLSRLTWSLAPHRDGRLLRCRKSNAYRKPPAQIVSITWYEDRLREVSERPYAEHLRDAVLDILEAGPRSVPELAAVIDEARDEDEEPVNKRHLATTMQRLKKDDLVVLDVGKWRKA